MHLVGFIIKETHRASYS